MKAQRTYAVTIYRQDAPINERATLTEIVTVPERTYQEGWDLARKLVSHPVLEWNPPLTIKELK